MKTSAYRTALRILPVVAMLAVGGHMRAETMTATFDAGLPEGWTMVGSLYNDSDRARSGKGIYTSSKSDKANYILTTEIEGDIEFYGRSYNTKGYGYITLYTVNDDNTPGDKIYEFRTDNVTSGKVNFQKFTYTIDVPRRVAIDLYWSCIDDFTYTPAEISAGASLTVSDHAPGSTYDFGGQPVGAGTTYSFTLLNKGGADLTISSIDITGGYAITEGGDITTLAAKESATLTVATPAADASGTLSITSDDPDSPYIINLTSIYKEPRPEMTVDTDAIDFGKVTDIATREITVGNTGDAPLTATLGCDSDIFSVSPASVTVAPGESAAVTVTYNYDASVYGLHTATLTVTPDAGETASIALSAKVHNPAAWAEDFSAGTLPDDWEAGSCWSIEDGVARAYYSYSDRNSCLTTPPLTVTAGDELTFMYRATAGYVTIKIMASRDGGEFSTLASISADRAMSSFEPYTIRGLEPGTYRFCFVNDDYELDDFEGFMPDMNAPKMEVSPLADADFGKVYASPEAITYTVANNGTGSMTVDITSDSRYFTVTPSTLTDIVKGEPQTFTVSFGYDIEALGDKNGMITVTPTYNADAAVSFAAHAVAKNPDIWEEDFEAGAIPADWDNQGEWSVSTPYVSGSNGSRMAAIRSFYPMTLTTPRLKATEGAELRFYIGMQYDDEPLTIEYSADKTVWTPIESGVASYTRSADITFRAPATGYYYIRFTGTYAMLDNFEGFRLSPKTHDLALTAHEIPAQGWQYATYTATATVTETYGNAEMASATLIVNGEAVATDVRDIAPEGSATFTLSFTPQEPMTDAAAQIEISYADEVSVTAPVVLTVTPAPVLDESEAPDLEAGPLPAIVVRYNAVAGWNTIAMPFALTDALLADIFGNNFEIFELSRFADETIEFDIPSSYIAGHPYVVYAPDVPAHGDIILTDIDIEAPMADIVERDGVIFTAFYAPGAPSDMSDVYLFNTGETGLHAGTEAEFGKGFRCYLSLRDATDGIPALKLGKYTGIAPVTRAQDGSQVIYNLGGQRVTGYVQPGIYIVNGRRTILR